MSTGASETVRRRGSARREELLNIAAQVFADQGFQGSTIRQVAERAGMLSGSLYYHFDSKDQMAVEVIRRYWDELELANRAAVRGSDRPDEQLRALVHASVATSLRRRVEVLILHQDWHYLRDFGDIDARFLEIQETWQEVVDEGVASGAFRQDLNAEIVYRTIMGALAWFPRWFNEEGRLGGEEVADMQADLFLKGVRAS